ncbi:endosomal SPRY domain protein, putative [Talaromyces stipitatus ATCC 10500]|uniref:Protein SSH4 n=1 Tax=Talaromyces stipitatus (strain ATCC 10500 / CBS 375.48 / QM 6759 / NRRL 1006) TaxID=441959 RepID=B8M2W8_TALSN|nr:endosomal SPRY domain protein, putative [Talaromyces stipitatus ATCC 10500]EED22223.1 endosomal SPRY domain protein, putative [Talaromyces stipitatus ATCC 10500]
MPPPDPVLLTPAMASPTGFTTSLRIHSQTEFKIAESTQQPMYTGVSSNSDIMAEIAAVSGSTGKGILIGILSALGSAGVAIVVLTIILFFKYTRRGRILLDRIGRPGEFDDEEAFAREEAEALETMDDLSRTEYLRAKAFIQANPPETMQTDISLSQFLAIQEKGVSAWQFEPELEIANCFVEARTEIEFFDSECSVQTNLPVPKQNEVYYWEAKIYDKPESTLISIGMTTKPYPLFRLPGFHKTSVAYQSTGERRYNQPFKSPSYGPEYNQGDVIGVGYRPRSGTIFFTRNGKKLEDVVHGLKSPNFFPTVGANGPCTIHVNFGQMGFVFIEANVKKWGLAPMTGSLAPPPPYGSEQGSILLESGRETTAPVAPSYLEAGYRGSRSTVPTSPGPIRSPTDISLAQLAHIPSHEDFGEGSSRNTVNTAEDGLYITAASPPPEYSSPESSRNSFRSDHEGGDASHPPGYTAVAADEGNQQHHSHHDEP